MAIAVYFLSVALIPMFFMSPLILAPSVIGAVTLFSFTVKRNRAKTHLIMLLLLIPVSLINPFYSHRGETVLFLINDTPFTLEALIYGTLSALTVITTLYWFRSFSVIMTEDKLLYVFGRFSPRLALTLSMALRYVALFTQRMRQVEAAQKANGNYKSDGIIDSLRSGARVFNVTVTWALENGIITAASMQARAYGTGKRTSFSLFRFHTRDVILLTSTLALLSVTVAGLALGGAEFTYYPRFTASNRLIPTLLAVIPYIILSLIPSIIEIEERLKWNYFLSEI